MLEESSRKKYFPPLVRETRWTRQAPGYEYLWFLTFEELHAYFSQEFGSDWRHLPWAQYWLGQHNQSRSQLRREQNERKRAYRMHDHAAIDELMRSELRRRPLSVRAMQRVLASHGYEMSTGAVFKCMQIIKQSDTESMDNDQ